MYKKACRLTAMCLLGMSLGAFAQSSGGEMKSDDNMKQDAMKHDTTKRDEVKKDKKEKKAKKDKMKKDEMKDDNMKHDDMKKQLESSNCVAAEHFLGRPYCSADLRDNRLFVSARDESRFPEQALLPLVSSLKTGVHSQFPDMRTAR